MPSALSTYLASMMKAAVTPSLYLAEVSQNIAPICSALLGAHGTIRRIRFIPHKQFGYAFGITNTLNIKVIYPFAKNELKY
jgi:hypothetical protein